MKIKYLRQTNNLSQSELAKIIGVSQKSISDYEKQKTQPDIETLIKLADYFHTTIDYILGHNVPYLLDKSTLSQEQQELLNYIQNLSPQNCKRVKDFITGILIAEEEKEQIINKYKKGE